MITPAFLAVVGALAFVTGARHRDPETRLMCWVVGAAAIVIMIRSWSHG